MMIVRLRSSATCLSPISVRPSSLLRHFHFSSITFDDTFDIKMKLIALLTLQALAVSAFTSAPSPVSRSALKHHHQSAASQLFAATGETDGSISRRDAGLQVAASAAAVLAGTNVANADDEVPGKLIEFTVNNLDGEEGKTGTFVVKTRPGK